MSFGMALLINTIIGMVLYPIISIAVGLFLEKKFGTKDANDGLEDLQNMTEDARKIINVGEIFWKILCWMINFSLWEIEWPCKIYMIYTMAKANHQITHPEDEP